MACAQTSSLSSTEGRFLKGEKGLAYWCMFAILHSLFLFFLFSLRFCYFDSFPLFSFFLTACSRGVMVMMLRFSFRGYFCCDSLLLCTTRTLYILPTVTGFY